jgi:hypothetical protein
LGRAAGLLPSVLLLLACAGPPPPATAALESRELSFLADGATTREQVALRLGLPARTFEADRIVLYRLGWTEARGPYPLAYSPQGVAIYDLVLVFDERDLLVRHALVAK